MVPNISPNGRSFRGAGAYHLHDKPDASNPRPRTSTRITFTITRNLANDNAHAAIDEMWRTAEDAAFLKSRSGASARGRKNDTPVKTISLAWAPGETPNPQQMAVAADSFLKHMSWHQHQAVYVVHSDTAHPHLHIILNRVHPDTGRTLNDWHERKRAQAWALGYEQQHGAVLCERRLVRETDAGRTPKTLPYPQARLLARMSQRARQSVTTAVRAKHRSAWVDYYTRNRRMVSIFRADQRSAATLARSLAREGDAARAFAFLSRFQRRQGSVSRSLSLQRRALARAQLDTVRLHAANDNSRPSLVRRPRRWHLSGARFAALPAAPRATNELPRLLAAAQRRERQQLRASHQAARTALCQRGKAAHATALAHSEIAVAFAARWAHVQQLQAYLRPAAIAALKAEQAAALSARIAYHLARLLSEQRRDRLTLSQLQLAERRSLLHRHRQAFVAAAAAVHKKRGMGPPLPPGNLRATPAI